MRAIDFIGPRKIRLLSDAPTPEPQQGEVLVQCRYVALCGTNMGPYLHDGRWANPAIKRPPGWLGHENIGVVVKSRAADWPEGTPVLAHPDVKAVNSEAQPDNVAPREVPVKPTTGAALSVPLSPLSWNVLRFGS